MVLVPPVKVTVPVSAAFVTRADLCTDLDAGRPPMSLWSARLPAMGRPCCWPTGHAPAPRSDTAWVGLDRDDNDRGGCGPRCWPRSPAARRCRRRSAATRDGPQARDRPDFIAEFAAALPGAGAADPADPRRRAGTGRPARAGQPAHLHPGQARDRPARAGQPARSTAVAAPAASGRPALRAARRAVVLHTAAGRRAAGELGLRLSPQQVEVLHVRTGGWPPGLRLAALGLAESADHDTFLTQFSGDDRSVADYLVGEILDGLPADLQDFLRVTSICDPLPAALAAQLSGRDDAGSVLDRLEHETSLVTATGPRREVYRIQELLRTHLVADLQRHGVRRVAGLHAVTARWWAAQDQPLPALEHATRSGDEALLIDLLHRLRPAAAPGRGPRAAAARAGRCRCPGRARPIPGCAWPRRAHPSRGGRAGGRAGTSCATPSRSGLPTPVRGPRRACAGSSSSSVQARPAPPRSPSQTPTSCPRNRSWRRCPPEPGPHPSRARRPGGRPRGVRTAALALSRRHGFDYLSMQCLTLLGVVAGLCGELRTMRTVSDRGPDHRPPTTAGRARHGRRAAAAMSGYSDLLRHLPADAERRTADALATLPALLAAAADSS